MDQRFKRPQYEKLWIGTAMVEVPCPIPICKEGSHLVPEHQVSDGPAGKRSISYDFDDAEEALQFAHDHAEHVIIEDDFKPSQQQEKSE